MPLHDRPPRRVRLAYGESGLGVVAPEAALDPDTFFDALAPYCEPPKAGHAEVVLVTRSWETPP